MIVAVDTGGTKTLVASFEANKKASKSHRFPTPKDPAQYLEVLARLLKTEYDMEKVESVCIAVPGTVSHNVLNYSPNLGWKNFDLGSALQKTLAVSFSVILQNDSNLAGLAEAHALTPRYSSVLYLTVSTGIGVSFVRNDHFNPDFSFSESGHMLLEYDGILREWEHFASGRAIYETYGRYARDITDKPTWEAIADKISRGFLVLLPIFQPEVVVIGGSIGTYFDRFDKTLKSVIDERLPEYIRRPKFIKARHTEEAVIYGCNIYAQQAR